MTGRNFTRQRSEDRQLPYKLDFRAALSWRECPCTGDEFCTTETHHYTGCPTLARDLVKFKADRAAFYGET